jgi:transcriptional regulator with XRE-family HTH domain
VAARLAELGERIREHRKRLKVSAVATAEAAGMSRVTLHRIERGEASVTIGAYMNAVAALGLDLRVVDPGEVAATPEGSGHPQTLGGGRLLV